MIQRYNEKLPVCAYCLQPGHTAWKCGKKPKKGLQTYKGLKVSSSFGGQRKPLKAESAKHKTNRQSTTAEFWKLNPPSHNGMWTCYLQISPSCPMQLTRSEVNPEHVLSKVRHPELRYEAANLKPACSFCNKAKGSRDWVDGQLV